MSSALIVIGLAASGCGKKGPPLPPLVKLPVAPTDFSVERRGDRVDLQFTVPDQNTDRTKPANVERVDVYALTGPANTTDAELFKYGTRVGSVDVKAPRDPQDTAEPDESADEVESPVGKGLDQGARASVDESLGPEALRPVVVAPAKRKAHADRDEGPLLGVAALPPARTYVSVGITTRGRKGAVSKRIALPLVAPPPAPSAPEVTYGESAVTVRWSAPEGESTADVLPSHALGEAPPAIGFNVYEAGGTAPPAENSSGSPRPPGETPVETRLTKAPVTTTEYSDPRMTWGAERCYSVRTVETIGGTTIESAASPERCVTLKDTFPPAAPKGLTAVASEGSISLIWEPNTEADLAGYIVLRGPSPDALTPITKPLAETTFKDDVQAGVKYVYAVEAVDKAGNVSAASNKVEETAR